MISNDPSGYSTPGGYATRKATSTVYVGNLDPRVDTELLYEIAIQAGPVKRMSLPPSRGYGFVEYESIQVAQYAVNLFCRGMTVYGKLLLVNFANQPHQ
eukprot:jgi/Picsp_1/1159/NSC_04640-R1_splicing factor 3b subunit 4-like